MRAWGGEEGGGVWEEEARGGVVCLLGLVRAFVVRSIAELNACLAMTLA